MVFIFLSPLHWLHAGERTLERIESAALIIQFEKPLRGAAQEVERTFQDMKTDLEETFAWKADFRPTVVLIKEHSPFQRLAGNPLVAAYALPRENRIVIDYSKMTIHPFSLGITLKHELAHLFVHHHIRSGNLPLWVDEGIAQWASGGIAEIIMGHDKSILKKASLSGTLIPLRALERNFPEAEVPLLLAYEESKSFIEFIDKTFGIEGIRNILHHLKNGDDIDTALMKALHVPLDTLEMRWHEKLKDSMGWLAYFGNNIYLLLFSITALATVYGFIKFWVRKKNYTDDEDEGLDWDIE